MEPKEKPDKSSEELQKEPAPPASSWNEATMVVTHARQCQQDALEEEECMRQEQDGPVISGLDPVNSGVQVKGTIDLMTEEGQAEAPEGSQVEERETEGAGASEDLTGVLIPQELGIAQRSDTILKIIWEKVGREGSPYFWEKGIL